MLAVDVADDDDDDGCILVDDALNASSPMGGGRLGNILGDTSIPIINEVLSPSFVEEEDVTIDVDFDDIAINFLRLMANLYAASSSSYALSLLVDDPVVVEEGGC